MLAIMSTAIGTAVCSPPRPAIGAMVPAATHWTNPSSGGAGAGVLGDLGGGERAAVGSDQALRGHQDEEADDRHDQRRVEPERADQHRRSRRPGRRPGRPG